MKIFLNQITDTPYRRSFGSIIAFSLMLSVFGFSSCRKFIEIPPPNTQLVTASVFNNNASATSAVLEIYSQMFQNQESYNMAFDNGLLSDELTGYATGTNSPHLYYTNALVANNNSYGPWINAYSYIYQANAVIAGLQQYSGTSSVVKQQLMGEAYFIRAFWHFYLTDIYGAVPVALTTNYTVTDKLSRTTRVQVLQQVVGDLQIAQSLLSNNYVDATDTAVTTDRVRPTKAVAMALLARAYLYLGNYDNTSYYTKADSAATAVINNSEYSLSPLSNVFLANSTEAIWQLDTPQPQNYDTPDGFNFILLAAPSSYHGAISPELLEAFEPGDQRRVNWVDSTQEGVSTYYFPYKYKNNTYLGTEYDMVLRLAEQYLIRAEAKAELGDSTAVNDLNAIRTRASLPNYAGATDKASLLAAILHERQVELFTEWGHRWFDLNRAAANPVSMVNVNTVLAPPGNVCTAKGGSWNSYKQLYPIPVPDLQKDVNLTQNSGY